MIFAKQVEKMYRAQLYNRCDENGTVFYFSAADFPGLMAEPYAFPARAGHTLQGYFYHYADPIPGRVVVFDHGMGGGHRAYMKEIEMLARHRYLVFAYDHTGCMESGGDCTNGFAQSLSDLDACLDALKADKNYNKMKISVMGHSWGGFSTLNIAAYHPDVAHIIAMSGFVSVSRILRQTFGGVMSVFYSYLYGVEQEANPDYVRSCAIAALKKTNAEVLVIHSEDDKTVDCRQHFDVLRKALSGRENIRFLLVHGKGHNPNYTEDAVRYKDAFFADLQRNLKKKALVTDEQKQAFVNSYDWDRMTAQDTDVWNAVFTVLDA